MWAAARLPTACHHATHTNAHATAHRGSIGLARTALIFVSRASVSASISAALIEPARLRRATIGLERENQTVGAIIQRNAPGEGRAAAGRAEQSTGPWPRPPSGPGSAWPVSADRLIHIHHTSTPQPHASGCVHEVQSGRESSGEPLGYLPPSDGGREKKA